MNDIESNKAVALTFLRMVSEHRHEEAFDLLSDDLQWWVPDSLPGGGFINKQAIYDKLKKIAHSWSQPLTFEIEYVTAEGDRVAVLMRSRAPKPDGTSYRQVYHQLMIIREGRIVKGYPFLDTLEFAQEVYGATVAYPDQTVNS